jgi:hypothetical protein
MSIVTAGTFAITPAASAQARYFGREPTRYLREALPVGVRPHVRSRRTRRRGTGTILVRFPKRAHMCVSLRFAVHQQHLPVQHLPVYASMLVEVACPRALIRPQPGLASKPKRNNRPRYDLDRLAQEQIKNISVRVKMAEPNNAKPFGGRD